jgi:3',5'-cyclic AMP phosphodiesterase CpdA
MALNRRSFLKISGTGVIAAAIPKSLFADSENKTVPNFSFIQLTDTHIPDESGVERSKKVVDAINNFSLPYEMVIHTGDVSHGSGNQGIMKKAFDLLQFKKKACFVPGNADVTFDHPEDFEDSFKSVFGYGNRSFLPVPGLRFVLFNSQPLAGRCAAKIREKAFSDLEKMLTPSLPTILFCHATGMPDFYENQMHYGWNEETMRNWSAIMTRGGVFAVLAGHFHRDEYHLPGDIPIHICAPVVGWWGRQTTFRHWTLNNNLLTYRTIYME